MKALTTRKKITLPSGGTCVVRAMTAMDFLSIKNRPKAFPRPSEIEKMEALKEADVSVEDLEGLGISEEDLLQTATYMEAILLRCVSPITYDGVRKKIVFDKELDELTDNEIAMEEVPQEDANEIMRVVGELGSETKEAGQLAETFPEGQPCSGDAPQHSEDVRETPE